MELTTNRTDSMWHNIKETVLFAIPSGAGITIWLDNIHSIFGIVAAIGTCIWIGYRIAIAKKEYKSKK